MQEVCFVCPWFGVFAGGAERAIRTLAGEMQRRGSDVEVLTTCSASLFDDWSVNGLPAGVDQIDGLTVRRFPLDQGRLDRYQRAVQRWVSGADLSRDEMYDFFRYGITSQELVEYVGKLPTAIPVVAAPYFQALTYRVVAENPGRVHLLGCFHDEPQFHWPPVVDMLRHARGVLFLAEEEKALAIRVHGLQRGRELAESPVVGMGVELEPQARALLESPARLAEIRRGLGAPDEYFLVVGRKDPGKGIPRLVEWYEGFSRRRFAAPQLVFIGGGDDSLIPHSTPFLDLGFVSEDQKLALLEGALATINLSPNESFSFVVMESWLCGTPVIVSSACAVTVGHCMRAGGGLVASDEASLCAALDVLRDEELGRQAGRSGGEYVVAEFNWDRVTDRFARSLSGPCGS